MKKSLVLKKKGETNVLSSPLESHQEYHRQILMHLKAIALYLDSQGETKIIQENEKTNHPA